MTTHIPPSTKELVKASVAIGFVVLLLERALVQLLQAKGAHKVLRVELAEHGGDASASDGLRAAGAQWSSLGVVMCLAVRESFVVKEGAALERQPTILKWEKEGDSSVSGDSRNKTVPRRVKENRRFIDDIDKVDENPNSNRDKTMWTKKSISINKWRMY